jgi:hypothetical protein
MRLLQSTGSSSAFGLSRPFELDFRDPPWLRFKTSQRETERPSDIPNISQKWDRLIPKPKRLFSSNS